jgi:hypothetical protein
MQPAAFADTSLTVLVANTLPEPAGLDARESDQRRVEQSVRRPDHV